MMEQAAIAGSAAEGVYSQTYSTGNFFMVLSLTGDEAVDKELGRNTLAKIEEMVTQTPEVSVKDLVEIINDEFKDGIKINLSIAKIQNQKLSLAGVGGVSAKLIRKGKIVSLLGVSSSGDQSPVSGVSGPVFHNDLLILGTDDFFSLLSGDDLVGHDNQTVAEIRDILLPKVESLSDNSKIAALLVSVDLISNPPEEITEEQIPQPEVPRQELPLAFSGSSLPQFFGQLKNKYLPNPRGLYLKNHYADNAPKISRRAIYLAIVVLISLVCIVAFQLRSRSLELSTKTVAAMNQQVQEGMASADKLAGVNDIIARQTLLQTRSDFITRANEAFGQNWQQSSKNSQLKSILAELDAKITSISHIYNISQLDIFYDFGLLKSGVKVASAGLEKNEIFAVDPVNGAAYSVGTKNKTAAILTGSEALKSGSLIDGIENNVYVITSGGIIKIDRSVQPATATLIIKPSDKLGDIKGLKTFGGNLYLLDISNSQVWKYQGTDLGFADIIPYLKSGGLDFSKVTGFAIDGYIYVLSSSGNVVRFASGYSDEFSLSGLPDPLVSPSSLFASDETSNIYILDKNNSRVIVVDKKGVYVAEYDFPAVSSQQTAVSLLADESVKKGFLVSGDKVFSFDLH